MTAPRRQPEPDAAEAGFFGKAPSHGDFVSNRFDRLLRERFDHWLQRAIVDSRRQLGERWDAAFASMPVWRFAIGADVAGGGPAIGVMAPSADRVGRAFPLVVSRRLQGFTGPTRALCGCAAWFDAAERLVRSVEGEEFDLGAFDEEVARLPAPRVDPAAPPGAAPDRDRSFWWREETEGARGARFASVGLPAASEFHRLLATVPAEPLAQAKLPEPAAAPPRPKKLVIAAGASSNAGTRHRINADAFAARPDLYAVADGVGDMPAAADAARLTLSKLGAIPEAATLDELVQLAKGALGSAHTILRAGAPEDAARPSASVAALLVDRSRFAVAWAGDARCHLVRSATVNRLTRDHIEIGLRRVLSRSVGGPGRLTLDVAVGEVEPDDRFVLCTGPLAAVLSERALASAALSHPPQAAADLLVQEALIAGVADNVTALVLHVRA